MRRMILLVLNKTMIKKICVIKKHLWYVPQNILVISGVKTMEHKEIGLEKLLCITVFYTMGPDIQYTGKGIPYMFE